MTVHIALLRAVNLGPHRRVANESLVEVCEGAGLSAVETYLPTGNVVFQDTGRGPIALETLLEKDLAKRARLRTEVFVRSGFEWATLLQQNPFPEMAEEDPSHLVVVFLKRAPSPEAAAKLRGSLRGPEKASVFGAHLFVTYPKGIARSPLTLARIEGTLGTRGTARNWNTVVELGRRAAEAAREGPADTENVRAVVRTFQPEDYPGVRRVWEASDIHLSPADSPEELERALERDPDLFLVAERDGETVGAVLGRFDGFRGWVYHLAVDARFRRQGIGRALMEEVERRLTDRGCPKVNLHVEAVNEAVSAFYQALGYDRKDFIFMGKWLREDAAPSRARQNTPR